MRQGYKQTDVGVIPEDWEVKSLGELISIGSSKRVLQEDWKSSGVPFYRTREIIALSHSESFRTPIFISRDLYSELKSKYGVPKKDDVLATGVGSIGRVYRVEEEHEFYFKDGNVLWFKMNERLNSEFLVQLFNTELLKKQLSDNASITTVATFTISGAKETLIPYPPTQEQRAIAEVLSDVDAEIESLARRHEKLVNQKQGLSEELLSGRTRLVEPKAKGFKQTDVGMIPEDWEMKTLESIADVVDPHPSHRAPEIDVQGVPFYGIGDLTEEGKPRNNFPRLVPHDVLGDHKKRYDLSVPSLALGRVASIGKVIDLQNVRQDFALSPTLGVITAKYIQHPYLKHILEFRTTSDQFDKIQSGSTRSSVGMNVLRELVVVLPPLSEQQAIAEVLSDVDAEIQAVAKLKAKVQAKKEGLIQTLLTGKIRLT